MPNNYYLARGKAVERLTVGDTRLIVAHNLKKQRKAKGLGTEEMARQLRIAVTVYEDAEAGDTPIGPDMLRRMAEILDITELDFHKRD